MKTAVDRLMEWRTSENLDQRGGGPLDLYLFLAIR